MEGQYLKNSGANVSDYCKYILQANDWTELSFLVTEFIEAKDMNAGIALDLETHLLKDFGFENIHSRMFPMTLLDGTKVGKLGW